MKFLRSDFLVVGIGTVVIATFSFLYYRDITSKVQAGSNELIGTITYKRKIAERKYAGQVVWEGIENKVPVYNYDTIRTSDQSEASVRLNDGTEIKLNENSMILLALTKNQIDIQFNQGSIVASRGDAKGDLKTLNIKSGSTNISIGKSDVKLAQNKTGDLNLSVAKGNAAIDTGKGSADLGADQALMVAKDSGDVVKFDLAVKLLAPASDSYHVTQSDKKKMDFSWIDIKGEHNTFFELSRDVAFVNVIKKDEVKTNAVSLDLEKEIYYWRIRAVHRITKKEEFSETRRFSILWDEPISLISPSNKEAVTYRNSLPIINFKWTASEIAVGYKLVVAADPSMNNVIRAVDSPQNSIVLDSLNSGVYYWRVEKNTGLKDILKTNPSGVFELNVKEKEITAPPELIHPVNGKQFSQAQLEKQNIAFTWKNIPEIREYVFAVSKNEEFKDIVFSGTSKVNFLQLEKNLPKGKYYWRVSGMLDGNDSTAPSRVRLFSIIDTEELKLVMPQNSDILSVDENDKSASVRFSWIASEIRGDYKVQISALENFSSLVKEITVRSTSTDISVRMEPGKYYWKVIVVDDDESILAFSRPRNFSVENNLDAPVVLSPKNGYTVNMRDKDGLLMNWGKVAGANLYRITVYQLKRGKEYKIAEIEEKGTVSKITDLHKLDESNFVWTLQAFEISGNKKDIIKKSPIVRNNFKITLGPVEKVDVKSLKIENL